MESYLSCTNCVCWWLTVSCHNLIISVCRMFFCCLTSHCIACSSSPPVPTHTLSLLMCTNSFTAKRKLIQEVWTGKIHAYFLMSTAAWSPFDFSEFQTFAGVKNNNREKERIKGEVHSLNTWTGERGTSLWTTNTPSSTYTDFSGFDSIHRTLCEVPQSFLGTRINM